MMAFYPEDLRERIATTLRRLEAGQITSEAARREFRHIAALVNGVDWDRPLRVMEMNGGND